MSEPFYRTYVNDCHRLGLVGTEAMVYSSLCFLCHNGAWSGTAEDISNFSCCGGRMTASRCVKSLILRGIVIRTTDGLILAQNEHVRAQNEHVRAQNEHFSKEKEKNQKNKENNKEIKEAEEDKSAAPANFNEIILYGKQQQIPEVICKKFYSYYTEYNWQHKNGDPVLNWKATLFSWFLREKKEAAKSIYQNVYGTATEQEQAAFAGSEYEQFKVRVEQAKQRDADCVSFDDYKKSK